MRYRTFFIAVLCIVSILGGCGSAQDDPAGAEAAVRCFVSIPPQAWLVRQIGGDRVAVEVMLPPGVGPHNYEPTARQIVQLGQADVYFRIGVPFEQTLLAKTHEAIGNINVVDFRNGITLRPMETFADAEHEHAGHDHHDHGPADPHTWMSPELLMIQARTAADELIRLDPPGAEAYRANLAKTLATLQALNEDLAKTLAPVRGREMFVYHPAYGYFADAYGLIQKPIEIEGKSPTARELGILIDQARKVGATVIFAQPQDAGPGAAKAAQAISGRVVMLDPLAEDVPANLRSIATKVRDGLAGQEAP
jgi:zinc transport system substrate-binding protein